MDDDDDGSVQTHTQEEPQQQAVAATPESEAAAAAAEVAAMERGPNARGRDPTGDEALMGAIGEEGVGNLEVVDESGELVRQAFLQFLTE
jgi:hypothetical protein